MYTVIEPPTFQAQASKIWRSGLKEGQPSLQDLQKARWYLDDEIKRIETLQKNG